MTSSPHSNLLRSCAHKHLFGLTERSLLTAAGFGLFLQLFLCFQQHCGAILGV